MKFVFDPIYKGKKAKISPKIHKIEIWPKLRPKGLRGISKGLYFCSTPSKILSAVREDDAAAPPPIVHYLSKPRYQYSTAKSEVQTICELFLNSLYFK